MSSRGRQRLERELAQLRQQRVELATALGEQDPVGDRGDSAQALQQADELAQVDDRIRELRGQIAKLGNRGADTGLPEGTVITLRFSDGAEETVCAVETTEDAPEDQDIVPVTLDSPLGRALAWQHKGDTITYETPAGVIEAHVVSLTPPSTSNS